MKARVWTVVTTCPGEVEPCLPSTFATEGEAETYLTGMLRAEWANCGPLDEESGERLPYPEGDDWRAVVEKIAEGFSDGSWGKWELHSEMIDLPEPEKPPTMKAYVLTYIHRHGEDVSVYATREAAEAARIGIAEQWWHREIVFTVAKPTDPVEMAAVYFEQVSERQGESATIAECDLIIDGPKPPAKPKAEPDDGLEAFTVERGFDAYQKWQVTIRASSAEEARDLANDPEERKRQGVDWEDAGVQEFDKLQYVTVFGADGEELLTENH